MHTLKEVCKSAMDYLARREHSELELRRKLNRKFDADQVERVIDEFTQKDLLSNKRFAESYIRSRINKGFGALRIAYELGQKGIAKDLARDLMLQCSQDWEQIVVHVLTKRFGTGEATNAKELTQRVRFLQHRGFSYELINKALLSNIDVEARPGDDVKKWS